MHSALAAWHNGPGERETWTGSVLMPNGGSDCCGTCWFNAKNKGEAGYDHADDPEPDICTIRSLAIENAFYTYCANHPRHSLSRITTPIGPVFTGDSFGSREIWIPSPDTEEVRQFLLSWLSNIQVQPSKEYPFGASVDEVAIWQLGEFEESRALEGLRRLASFDPEFQEPGPFERSGEKCVRLARQALEKIERSPH